MIYFIIHTAYLSSFSFIKFSFLLQTDKLKRNISAVEDELRAHKSLIGGELTNKKRRSDLKRKVAGLEDRVEHVSLQKTV